METDPEITQIEPDISQIEFSEMPAFDEASNVRAKSPLRFKYEAQVEVLKKEIGDLEDVRRRLGLTRRQIAQLLLVDPSAWTRWAQTGAPPHVYQALSWYLKLEGLGTVAAREDEKVDVQVTEKLERLQASIDQLPQPDPNREIGYLYQVQRELQSQSKIIDTGLLSSRRWLVLFAVSQAIFLILTIWRLS